METGLTAPQGAPETVLIIKHIITGLKASESAPVAVYHNNIDVDRINSTGGCTCNNSFNHTYVNRIMSTGGCTCNSFCKHTFVTGSTAPEGAPETVLIIIKNIKTELIASEGAPVAVHHQKTDVYRINSTGGCTCNIPCKCTYVTG